MLGSLGIGLKPFLKVVKHGLDFSGTTKVTVAQAFNM